MRAARSGWRAALLISLLGGSTLAVSRFTAAHKGRPSDPRAHTEAMMSAVVAQAADDFAARENAVWQAIQDKKFDTFAAALDKSFVAVYADGVHTRDAEIAAVRQVDQRSFRLTDLVIHPLDAQTTLLTYKAAFTADAAGADISGTYWASSLWRKTAGRWRTVFHTEVKTP